MKLKDFLNLDLKTSEGIKNLKKANILKEKKEEDDDDEINQPLDSNLRTLNQSFFNIEDDFIKIKNINGNYLFHLSIPLYKLRALGGEDYEKSFNPLLTISIKAYSTEELMEKLKKQLKENHELPLSPKTEKILFNKISDLEMRLLLKQKFIKNIKDKIQSFYN